MLTQSAFPHRWPSQCLVCRAWPAHTICDDCTRLFIRRDPRCRTCAMPVPPGISICGACLLDPPLLQRCLVAVDYAWPWTDCIARFKFGQQPELAAALARLLLQAPDVALELGKSHLVLAVPAAPERMAERGYNPALLLARRLGGKRCRPGLLLRARHTPPQRGLARTERLRNVRGAFAIAPGRDAQLDGRRVALVDDVMTTGATLYEAARILRAAGAAQVVALALARDA